MSTNDITTEPVPLGVIVILISASVPSAERVVPANVTPAATIFVSNVVALIVVPVRATTPVTLLLSSINTPEFYNNLPVARS